MKKKKAKYGLDPIIDKRTDVQKSAWESTYNSPIVVDPKAIPEPMKYDMAQADRPAPSMLPDQYYTSKTEQINTGLYDLHPMFKGVNTLALATTGIAQAINEGKNSRAERLKYLSTLQNRFVENNPTLNEQPAYFKDGGEVNKDEYDTIPSYLYYLKAAQAGDKDAQELAANHIRDVRGDGTSRAIQHIGNNLSHTNIHDMAKRGVGTETDPQIKHLYSLINDNPDLIDKFDYSMPKNKDMAFSKPKMPYGGGPLTSEGAKEILKDGTIRGKKITDKQKRYFGYIAGGGKPKAKYGLPPELADQATVEAEAGEAYTTSQGDIEQIPDSAPTHEQGGVLLNNVDRVLEDTSTSRKDIVSKALKVTPDKFQAMFGFATKRPLSHSKALEKASKHFEKKADKIKGGIEGAIDILDKNKNDFYANNSLNLNLKTVKSVPTSNDVFNLLFEHQENVKDMLGVEQDKAKYGKYIPKAAFGFNPPDKTGKWSYDNNNTNGKKKGWNGMVDFKSPQDYASKIGFPGNPQDIIGMQRWVMQKYPELVKHFHDPKTGYGMPAAGTPDDGKLGVRWNDIGKAIAMKVPPMPKVDDPNLVPPDAPAAPQAPAASTPSTAPAIAPGINLRKDGKPSTFNESLRWYDTAGPLMNLMSSDRIPAQYNPVELNEVKLKQQNPTAALEAGNRDYNAALSVLPDSGAGMSNAVNAFSSKYSIDNQVLGQYENANAGIKNQEVMYNANVRDRQSVADQQSRGTFEQQELAGKEAQRQQKLKAFDDLFTRVALNRKLNREGNLIMQLAPNFNQQGQYNGNQRYITPTYTGDVGANGSGISYITDPRTGKELPVLKENGKLQNKSKILSGLPK